MTEAQARRRVAQLAKKTEALKADAHAVYEAIGYERGVWLDTMELARACDTITSAVTYLRRVVRS